MGGEWLLYGEETSFFLFFSLPPRERVRKSRKVGRRQGV